jgi:hypothetical protein
MITVAIVNESTVVNDTDMPPVVAALQKQVSGEFCAAWGIDARLVLVPRGQKPDPMLWQLIIADDSDQAQALGYHETTATGQPIGFCFAKTTAQDGGQWTVTASHELLEMLADPAINLTVLDQGPRRIAYLFAFEAADPVEEATYLIDGVQVSDFVLPSYFQGQAIDGATPAGPFDHLGQLAHPLPAMLAGGYLSVLKIGESVAGWQQIIGQAARHSRVIPPVGSRRHRRMLPRHMWRRSER